MTDSSPPLLLSRDFATTSHQSWLKWALLFIIFGAGVAAGVGGSALVIRQRILAVIRQPEQIPDRVIPILCHRLSLNDEQSVQVAAIMRRRYAAVEELRSEFTPRITTELHLLQTEVDAVLSADQKERWAIWCQRIEECLPSAPLQMRD